MSKSKRQEQERFKRKLEVIPSESKLLGDDKKDKEEEKEGEEEREEEEDSNGSIYDPVDEDLEDMEGVSFHQENDDSVKALN